MHVIVIEKNGRREVCNNGRIYGMKYEAALERDRLQEYFPQGTYRLCELVPVKSLNED